jgi:hypothetical protein
MAYVSHRLLGMHDILKLHASHNLLFNLSQRKHNPHQRFTSFFTQQDIIYPKKHQKRTSNSEDRQKPRREAKRLNIQTIPTSRWVKFWEMMRASSGTGRSGGKYLKTIMLRESRMQINRCSVIAACFSLFASLTSLG